MGQTPPNRPDIRSKALTDTDEKKKKLQKLGLSTSPRSSTETFQRFFNRVRNNHRIKEDDEIWTAEANLNDYVKKYQMKMGNKTSTVDKDAWVDGIGGLSKREAKTLKRQLQGHTREGETSVRKFKKGQPNPQLDAPKGKKRWEETEDEGYGGTNKWKKGQKKMKKAGITLNRKDKSSGWVEDTEIDELSKEPGGILQRAAGAAKKDAAIQRDAQAWAKRVPGKGHAFGAAEAGKKAAKRERQAGKFSAAVDVKQRDTAFSSKKEDVIDEKESDYADKIAAFKKKGGKVEKQPDGPISKSLFRTTVGREKRRNPGKQATRGTFYDEVEVKEVAPVVAAVGRALGRAAVRHVAKKAVQKMTAPREKKETVSEITKKYLDRAAVAANRKADQQRAVSKVAASRVGDTSQPPGQNIKSKRADFQAAKKDYQAFKFGVAAKKKEKVDESNKLQADMALDDAGIKSYWEDGKLWVDKKDVVKAEKTLTKSFKKGGEPHIYYKGGFLGVWNKKRKITG
jgi:hypothetical protein